MADNVANVTENDGVRSVAVSATNGKPIATVKVVDKDAGTEVPVNVTTCTEAVFCNEGIPMQTHLQNLYGHTEDAEAHLTAGEKQNIETKTGAQAKATAAKNEAIAASSLEIATARSAAATDATNKANAARDAGYRYTDNKVAAHVDLRNNPHNVTAAQVGLGNVPNKATNDLQPTYSAAGTLSGLTSGERLTVAFGKIAKAISDLIAHIGNKANPHDVSATQIGAIPAIESRDYTGCYYRTAGGKTEWINPPLIPGVEYRTINRFGDMAEYVKLVQVLPINIPETGDFLIPHGISGLYSVTKVYATYGSNGLLPWFDYNYDNFSLISQVSNAHICLRNKKATWSESGVINIVVHYTKGG